MSNSEHSAGGEAHRAFRCTFGPVREKDLVWPPPDEDVAAFTVVRLDGGGQPPSAAPSPSASPSPGPTPTPTPELASPAPPMHATPPTALMAPTRPTRSTRGTRPAIKPTFGDCRAPGLAPRIRPLVVPAVPLPPPLPPASIDSVEAVKAAEAPAMVVDTHADQPPVPLLTPPVSMIEFERESTTQGRSAWLAMLFAAACAILAVVEYRIISSERAEAGLAMAEPPPVPQELSAADLAPSVPSAARPNAKSPAPPKPPESGVVRESAGRDDRHTAVAPPARQAQPTQPLPTQPRPALVAGSASAVAPSAAGAVRPETKIALGTATATPKTAPAPKTALATGSAASKNTTPTAVLKVATPTAASNVATPTAASKSAIPAAAPKLAAAPPPAAPPLAKPISTPPPVTAAATSAVAAASPTAAASSPVVGAALGGEAASARPAAAVMTAAVDSDDADIRSTLTRFRTAYSQLDASAARAVWPSVDARALERAFQSLKSQELRFERCSLTVTGARAQASCTGRATYVPRIGDQSPRFTAREWTFELRKADERWTIASARTL